jgi:hypothetical protein
MKLWYSYLKELKLASKSFYFYMEVVMAVIMIVILTMVVPENFSAKATEYLHLDLDDSVKEMYIDGFVGDDVEVSTENIEIGDSSYEVTLYESAEAKVYLFDNEAEMADAAESKKVMAISISIQDNKLFFDYYLQGYESEKFKNIMKSASVIIEDGDIESAINGIKVTTLGDAQDELTDRENLLPLFLYFNGSLMGLFIIASYIFLDKGEGVIKAYAVTPSSVTTYLLSKVLLISTTAIISSFALTTAVMGFDYNILGLLLIILTSGFFVSVVGLILSSYYTNIMQSFGVLYILIILLSLPAIAYNIPAWNPVWVSFIPTYYIMYGLKEVLTNGDFMFVLYSSLGFLVLGLALLPVASYRFKKTLA